METTNRRRFTVVFKAQVALDTLHGDKTVQEIAADRKVLLNQVSTRKRRAMDGLARIFSKGADEAEVHDLHSGKDSITNEGAARLFSC